MKSVCGRCHTEIAPGQGYALYHEVGGLDAGSKARINVHGECIAEDMAAGRLHRVSAFSFEPVEPASQDWTR